MSDTTKNLAQYPSTIDALKRSALQETPNLCDYVRAAERALQESLGIGKVIYVPERVLLHYIKTTYKDITNQEELAKDNRFTVLTLSYRALEVLSERWGIEIRNDNTDRIYVFTPEL